VGDALRRARRTTGRAARTVCSPAGLRGTGLELVWSATHLALYPLGLGKEKERQVRERLSLDSLPPVQRGLLISDVEAAGTPILLLHGLIDNRSVFALLRRGLLRRGFGRVATMNYSPRTSDVRSAARRLSRQVEQLCEETGYERVHVVGHSLGGVIARYYVQCLGGDARVHTLATLGSPHSGTLAARLLPTPLVRQLRPDSSLIRELAAPAPDCRTRFLAVWSDLDHLMVPKRSARIDHPDLDARNVLRRRVGHMSLPIDPKVIREIVNAFAHLDVDGHTVTRGVTSIAWTPPAPPREEIPPRPAAPTGGTAAGG
jgi:triacylglycerol lipase